MSNAKSQREKFPHTYKGNRTEQSRRYRMKNKAKYTAQFTINNMIQRGEIIRPEICSMCGQRGLINAHHHDYNKPLDVIWVCWECHNKIHNT